VEFSVWEKNCNGSQKVLIGNSPPVTCASNWKNYTQLYAIIRFNSVVVSQLRCTSRQVLSFATHIFVVYYNYRIRQASKLLMQ